MGEKWIRRKSGLWIVDPSWTVAATDDDTRVHWNGTAWVANYSATGQWAGYNSATVLKIGGGMRFTNVTIPNGATILTAVLSFVASVSLAGTTVNSVLIGEAADDAAAFSTIANYQGRRGTIVGGADDTHITAHSVAWNAIPAWTSGTTYTSDDFAAVVQDIVNRAGWVSGNHMVIFWDDHAGLSTASSNCYRSGASYDEGVKTPPTLTVTYSVGKARSLGYIIG